MKTIHSFLTDATASWISRGIQAVLLLPILVYRWVVSPVVHALGGPGCGCRFHPSCSVYAADAIRIHGAVKGSWLAIRRVLRCHPWGGEGYDPVPPPRSLSTRADNRRQN